MPAISDRFSYEKWAADDGDEYAHACELVETTLAEHAAKAAYIDGDQLHELAAICRVDEDTVRRARRG
jgi:trimethylamine:corrinoid methyltransferase-like protein